MAFCNLTYTSAMPTERIKKLLFNDLELQERELPISDILLTRQQQVVDLIQSWDLDLEKEILAENFYLDQSREERMSEIKDILNKAGELGEIRDMNPINQLRGYFEWNASADTIEIFFTLTPEANPKIQYLDVSLKDESN
jgi:hypothetical protein